MVEAGVGFYRVAVVAPNDAQLEFLLNQRPTTPHHIANVGVLLALMIERQLERVQLTAVNTAALSSDVIPHIVEIDDLVGVVFSARTRDGAGLAVRRVVDLAILVPALVEAGDGFFLVAVFTFLHNLVTR